jgi:hypothetical protein
MLSINLDQNGWNLLIQIVGSLVGGLIAIWVYVNGNKTNVKRQDLEKKRIEIDKLRYSYSLIKGAISFTESLRENLDLFIGHLDTDPSTVPRLSTGPHNTLSRFVDKINQEEHYHAYRNQICYGTSITEIFKRLDFIDSLRNNLYQQFVELSQRNFDDRRKFMANVDDGVKLLLDFNLIIKAKDDPSEQLLRVFRHGIENYQKIYRLGDLIRINTDFLQPLTRGIIDYQIATRDMTYSTMLYHFTTASTTINHSIRNLLAAKSGLVDDKKNLDAAYFSLIQACQNFDLFIRTVP